ncbi:MAG: deoxyribodipyrimidine photo-lyase, partial [Pseudomonadota bacterium]
MTSDPLTVIWFKRDLRIADHRALAAAARDGRPLLPLYVAEPALWAQPTMSARQWAFVAESLAELRAALAALGQPLVMRVGDVVETLEAFRRTHGIAALHSHEETGDLWTFARDRRVADWAQGAGVRWTEHRQTGVIRRLKTRDGWAKEWDRFMAEPEASPPAALPPLDGIDPGPIPDAADLGLSPDPCPERQIGGSEAGHAALRSFLEERGETYRKDMSSPLAAERACSRLSPYLAWGAVSSREAAQALWARQVEVKAAAKPGLWKGALSSFSGRLHWRDHFMQKLEDEPEMETRCLHPAYEGLRPATPEAARLRAWAEGETG